MNVSAADNFRVMLYDASFPPYFFDKEDPRTGIVKDLFSAFGKETGDTFEYVRVPFKRALHQFDSGQIDIEPMSNPAWRGDSAVLGEYSIPMGVSELIVLFNADKYLPIESPKDLTGRTIGVVMGYYYPSFAPYFEDGSIKPHVLPSDAKLIQLLEAGRLDQAIMNKDFALYQIKEKRLHGKLKLSRPCSALDMMVRFHPSKKDAIPRFNKAIRKLLDDGTIKRIYDQYR
ncbi:substrate-binding periplasmic protein [Maridesulfovibrio sp. FT414]|uniref:substrate-binding periplasmic protein n=1 Tax=Maridesulfovibrio sp. FT414 TaxID=2979469 RepID=UPI003D8083AF